MTIAEAIAQTDLLKPNSYSDDEKTEWILRLEAKIKNEIIDTHEAVPADDVEDEKEKLLASVPYDEVYLRWLEAQIDYANGEIERYNNSITAFNFAYSAFERFYNRTHLPKTTERKYF